MTNITPKGKKILTVVGIIVVIILGWLFFPQLQLRTGTTAPEEFSETPHTEFSNFVGKLPHKTDHYRVEFDDYYNQVLVVPLVEIDGDKNPVEEMERVWSVYEQYANEAVAWMKAEGVDFASFELKFWNEDFWPQGKAIKY